jgi:tRNA dimethylallyltransferase
MSAAALTVIAGPTASGKSRLALELAQALNAEIINADSQQVYSHFDIGTAKPSAHEMALVRHHLISHVSPLDRYSAARFQNDADVAIADILRRQKRVIVTGGTGLYVRILLHGVVAAPSRDETLRAALEQYTSQQLHEELERVDAESAAKLPLNDRVRLIRALEIFKLSGQTASQHRKTHDFLGDRYTYRLLVLNPEREMLYQQINHRTAAMFRSGLIEETKSLVSAGFRGAAPMGAVGYVQALAVVDGALTLEQAIEDTAQATRHYAKRQVTWFKKEAGAEFISPHVSVAEILRQLPREA